MAPRDALLAEIPTGAGERRYCIASTHGRFGPGVGGSICGPLRSNVAGGSISALATLATDARSGPTLSLPAGSIDGSISGGSIGPTHETRPQPDASLRLSFPSTVSGDFCLSLKAADFQFIPLRRSNSSLRCFGAAIDLKSLNASCILTVCESTSCAIGLSLDSVPLRTR